MTTIYYVRHAEPDYSWKEDAGRPLTKSGMRAVKKVDKVFRHIQIDRILSSPYRRSITTIQSLADSRHMIIETDSRLRERESGIKGNIKKEFYKRWGDFSYHEEGGESLEMTQKRNIEAITEILEKYPGETIVIGGHGTALSTILNYYDPDYGVADFYRMIHFLPYVVKLEMDGKRLLHKQEILIVNKSFKRTALAAVKKIKRKLRGIEGE
ncbi:MAG: histidine phosphatase family protein [Lachnospiraceae bacterium]